MASFFLRRAAVRRDRMKLAPSAFAVYCACVLAEVTSVAGTPPFAFHFSVVESGGNPRGIVAADFDGDGHLDFATSNVGSSPRDVSVWYGDGHGAFGRSEFV